MKNEGREELLFHVKGVPFPLTSEEKEKAVDGLRDLIADESKGAAALGELNIIFCSDEELQQLHWEYLKEAELTDIITFDYVQNGRINGDLFISTERVAENAELHQRPLKEELHRVMAHGVLHLLGYKDKNGSDRENMRAAEDRSLQRWGF